MANDRSIAFNALPEATRKRLVEVLHGRDQPAALFSTAPGKGAAFFGWGIVALIGLGPAAVLLFDNFGSSWRGMLGPEIIGALLVLGWIAAYAVFRGIRRGMLGGSSPVPPGVWVFPMDVIDTTGKDVRIAPLASLKELKAVHQHTNGIYTGTTFNFIFDGAKNLSFSISGKAKAEVALANFQATRRAVFAAIEAQDWERVAAYDPLIDARMQDDWKKLGPEPAQPPRSEPRSKPLPGLLWRPGMASLGVAVIGAPLLWGGRNYASDEVRFERIQDHPSVSACESYVRDGWSHVDAVRDEWMPKAELREAIDQQSVAKLRNFVSERPDHPLVPEAKAAIHTIYTEAAEKFAAGSNGADPRAIPFITALLEWNEAHDNPSLVVRYRSPSTESLAQLDGALAEAGGQLDGATVVPVGPYFTPDGMEQREGVVTRSLKEGFSKVFAADVLDVSHGGRITEEGPVDHPVIDVSYIVAPSGTTYASDGDPRVFVGIVVLFDVAMRVPDDPEPFVFEVVVEPPNEFYVTDSPYMPLDSKLGESTIYSAMASHAYEKIAERLHGAVFGAPGEGGVLPSFDDDEEAEDASL